MSLKSIFANAVPGAKIGYFNGIHCIQVDGQEVEETDLMSVINGEGKAYYLKGKKYVIFRNGDSIGSIFPDGSVHFSGAGEVKPSDLFDAFIFPNGDVLLDVDNSDDGNISIYGAAGVSFGCLEQFFPSPLGRWAFNDFRRLFKKTQIIDFTDEQYSDKPKPGFSKMGNRYHRAGSTVLRIQGKDYLFGFDDGQYFGCELPRKVEDINDAYLSLMPKAAKGKKGVQRQGEWFFVPLPKSFRPPEIRDCVIVPLEQVALPVEDEQSNKHIIECCGISSIHDCVFITRTKQGMSYFVTDVSIRHEQHPTIVLRSWHEIHKNLAVRSVSQDGVD